VNPQDPLAALAPLREPPPVGWWPPAAGWWLLLGLGLLGLAALAAFLIRRLRRNAYRRRALALLAALRETHAREGDLNAYVAGVNALLKSVALYAWPRREVAARHGGEWLAFLEDSVKSGAGFPPGLADAPYRESCPALDPEQLHRAAAAWIRRHGVPR
jgi:hypothetical protein